MGFFTEISNKFISGYADAFFVYCSVPVCFLYSSTGSDGGWKGIHSVFLRTGCSNGIWLFLF